MGVLLGLAAVLLIAEFGPPAAADPVCASRYADLDLSPKLASIKPLFDGGKQINMVNETKGSYIVIRSVDGKLSISFFTSGIFDLYPIRKDGPLTFCDDGEHLVMEGLGRSDTFTIEGKGVRMGDGGAKGNFVEGEMPTLLQKLHKVNSHGVSSEAP